MTSHLRNLSETPWRSDIKSPQGPLSSGNKSGQISEPRAVDIWARANEFPERWARLMKVVFGADVRTIMAVFPVSDRAARKWIAGDGGVNSRHSTIAQLYAPEAYAEIILGEGLK